MALSRLLLLWMVASEVWDAETKPIDFVCNKSARRAMNIVAEMESALSPISLSPCSPPICPASVSCLFHVSSLAEWLQWLDNPLHTSSATLYRASCSILEKQISMLAHHQEKRGDIVASLRLLIEGVKVVMGPSQLGCVASLLQRMENNINNYLLILTHLQLNGPVVSPALTCVPRSTQSLSRVLLNYNQLISGKLEWFMVDLEDRCISQ
ncbi:thrombopoietin isoform X2 [Micropterus salmoides]|uniref:thrombopoietin isoform X2 n=1 Tax=Micropterus salmoides TaxID=27706 RepID=UPI0018EB5172|nr:thrombopoietin isoform X2 [Micropterus salmoides]